MKVLLVHNYLRPPSGENIVFEHERSLLEAHGHKIAVYVKKNEEITTWSLGDRIGLPLNVIWSQKSYQEIKRLIQDFKPQIVHFHNIFPLISPSAYYACQQGNIPVVQTLHNFRLICPGALLFRNGKICEECLRKSIWRGVLYGCYHNSKIHTAGVATMVAFHRLLQTWSKQVTLYITLTEFATKKFIDAGFPKHKLVIKPNFLINPPSPEFQNSGFVVFIGRLGEEKGLKILIEAWRNITTIPLKIIGEGPMRFELEKIVRELNLSIEILGYRPPQECMNYLKMSQFFIFPSIWYEGLPMVVLEAMACGKPIIASGIGVLPELIKDKVTGLLFEPGNVNDLVEKIKWMINHKAEAIEMGKRARVEFEDKYIADKNYELLMDIYQKAIEINKKEHGF